MVPSGALQALGLHRGTHKELSGGQEGVIKTIN